MADIEAIWDDLLDKDDRNSPEEYPDMVLITYDELSAILAAAVAPKESDGGVEAQRHAAPIASVPAGETSGSDGVAAIPSDNHWRPIEEAPKDGTEIIGVYHRPADGMFKATTYGPWTIAFDGRKWRSSWDNSEVISYMSDFGIDYKEPDVEPTHWQPLPTTPSLIRADRAPEVTKEK